MTTNGDRGDLPPPDVVPTASSLADPLEALRAEYQEVSKIVQGLGEPELARPTRCSAWNVGDLVAHLLWGATRAHRFMSQPASDTPDSADGDSVSYWRSSDRAGDAPRIADRAKDVATRYTTARDLAQAWDDTWPKVVDTAEREHRRRLVATWGPTLALDEYLKTQVLEVTVHRMDLEDALGLKGWGTDQAVSIVDDTLEGLLGEQPPSDLEWDVVDFIETGTGRRPLTEEERKILGPLAQRFPLLE